MNNMNILVTGGLGFIGSHLVDYLIDKGHTVVCVDDLSTGSISNRNPKAENIRLSVCEFCKVSNRQFDLVFHLANSARIAKSFIDTENTLVNNYNSTVSLCEYMRKTQSKHLFFASSSTTEFTDIHNNPYTFSKYMCDELLILYRNLFNLSCSTVKFYNVYGSMREKDIGHYTTVIRKFKKQYLHNEPLTVIGDGSRTRDFTHIDDTIEALGILSELVVFDQEYHIGSETATSILDIAKAFDTDIEFIEDRNYELKHTLCMKQNIPNWKAKISVLEHIKEWIKENEHR